MTVSINGTTGVTTPQIILTNGSSTVTLLPPPSGTVSGTPIFQNSSGALTLSNTSGGSLILQPAVGSTTAQTLAFPATAGANGQVLTSDGSGGSTWGVGGGGGLTIGTTAIASGTTGSILINTSSVLQQLIMGTGVSAALGLGTGTAGGLPVLGAGGVLQPANGGTGVNALGAGVQTALGLGTGTAGGFPTLGAGGVLQPANGGTGVNSLGTGVAAALQANAGGPNGLATLDASGILPTSQGGTGNSSPAGTVAVGSATQTGTLTLYNTGAAANPTSIQSSSSATTPWTLTLPTGPGTNGQVLSTNGSGVASWITPAVVAGANTEVQYNSAGVLSANGGFTYDGTSAITLGTASTSIGRIVLNNGTNSNNVAIRSGTTTIGYTITLPTTPGLLGYFLTTDGSGNTTWSAPAAAEATGGNFNIGTPSGGGTPTTGNLNLYNSGSTDAVTIQSGNNTTPWTLTLPTDPGTIGQVMQTDGSGNASWVSGDITLGTTTVALGSTAATLSGLDMVTVSALGYVPANAGDLTSKQYVDALFSAVNNNIGGVNCATTAPINLTGLQTIDGVTLIGGERVLVKDGSIANGLQDCGVYDVSAGGVWTYSSDANTWAEYVGALVFVIAGTTYANTSWLQTVGVGGTLGTTPMSWAEINSPLNYSGGTGITVVGNVINNTGVVSIATGTTGLTYAVGAGGVTTVTGQLSIANGGTGQGTAQAALDALLPNQGPNNGKVLSTDGTNASWVTPIASSATGGTFNIGTGGSTQGNLNLYNSTNANSVTLSSGINTTPWTLTLPTDPGTNGYVLSTDGSGNTSWVTVGSGTVNSGTANQLAYYSATGTAVSGNANATVSSGALTLGVAGTAAGSLVLSGSTSGTVTVKTAAAAGTWNLTLPTTAGSNGQVLATDGSGATSWTTPIGYTRSDTTATAGQTTFAATYTVNYVEVYINGVLLALADYTATNGTSIVLATGANVGDIITIVNYK